MHHCISGNQWVNYLLKSVPNVCLFYKQNFVWHKIPYKWVLGDLLLCKSWLESMMTNIWFYMGSVGQNVTEPRLIQSKVIDSRWRMLSTPYMDLLYLVIWMDMEQRLLMGNVTLVAITGTIIIVPYLEVKSLELILRSGTRRWNLRVPDRQMSCKDLITC